PDHLAILQGELAGNKQQVSCLADCCIAAQGLGGLRQFKAPCRESFVNRHVGSNQIRFPRNGCWCTVRGMPVLTWLTLGAQWPAIKARSGTGIGTSGNKSGLTPARPPPTRESRWRK